MWNCSHCETSNPPSALQCEVCQADRPAEELWLCPNCEAGNSVKTKTCEVCGSVLATPKKPDPIPEDEPVQPIKVKATQIWVAPSSGLLPVLEDRPLVLEPRPESKLFPWYTLREEKTMLSFLGMLGLGLIGMILLPAAWKIGLIIPVLFGLIFSFVQASAVKRRRTREISTPPPYRLGKGKAMRTQQGHQEAPVSLSFSSEGSSLLSLDASGKYCLWDSASGVLVLENELKANARAVVSGGMIFQMEEDHIKALYPNLREVFRLKIALKNPMRGLVFRKDKVMVLQDEQVDLFKNGNLRTNLQLERETVYLRSGRKRAFDFNPESQTLLLSKASGALEVWDLVKSSRTRLFQSFGLVPDCVAISTDNQLMALGDRVGNFWIYRFVDGRAQAYHHLLLLDPKKRPVAITAIDFTLENHLLAVGDATGMVRLVDGKIGNEICTLETPLQKVNCLEYAPETRLLAAAGDKEGVICWIIEYF